MDRHGVIVKIEDILEGIVDSILAEGPKMTIPLARRALSFPGKTPDEAWRFIVLRILELMHEALRTNVICTKRDIFYKDPALFGAQRIVDDYVDEIARTFGVSRPCLNVVATSKGLAAGAFTMQRTNGVVVDGSEDSEGFLIPTLNGTETFNLVAVQWILVVEKDATFHALASSAFWTTLTTQGMMITGKGYPDLATRKMLHQLTTDLNTLCGRQVPVLGLFDYDPDGLAIFSTYKRGSVRLAHETENLDCPSLRWLGVMSSHIYGDGEVDRTQGLLQLSQRDRKKAVSMLGWHGGIKTHYHGAWYRELQVMLMLNLKAEIQILDSSPGGLLGWIGEAIVV